MFSWTSLEWCVCNVYQHTSEGQTWDFSIGLIIRMVRQSHPLVLAIRGARAWTACSVVRAVCIGDRHFAYKHKWVDAIIFRETAVSHWCSELLIWLFIPDVFMRELNVRVWDSSLCREKIIIKQCLTQSFNMQATAFVLITLETFLVLSQSHITFFCAWVEQIWGN